MHFLLKGQYCMTTNNSSRRAVFSALLLSATAFAASAQAQTAAPAVLKVTEPMMPQGPCNSSADPYAGASFTPPCSGAVSSTITITREAITDLYPFDSYFKYYAYDRDYHRDYKGDLIGGGIIITSYGNYAISMPAFAKVNANMSYDASETAYAFSYGSGSPVSPPVGLQTPRNIRGLVASVNSINVKLDNFITQDNATGVTYSTDIVTVDPTAITNNATAITGKFRGTGSKIQFGTISGTAQVKFGSGDNSLLTGPSTRYGGPETTYASMARLEVTTTATVTTQLDETGLITPTVSVTDGIQMNGSRVSGLGAGVSGGDAVNMNQLNSEANARAAADLGLANRIDLLGTRFDRLQTQVNLLDRHIASSTAVAVAMSGNTFLPDMKFNLSANVGTYDGAHAGSLQIGALVSRHVAINAGVATGFNKGGKTAGRVGMTLGW